MNDGGSAFPTSGDDCEAGMTLRDYFAAAALTGYIVACDTVWRERYANNKDDSDDVPTLAEYARTAYRIADSMLAERNRKEST